MSRSSDSSLLKRLLRVLQKALLWLPNLLLLATERLETRFGRLRKSRSVKKIGQVDQQASRIFRTLTRPFSAVWKWTANQLDRLRLAARTNPALIRIGKLTYWIWYPILTVITFLAVLLYSRSRAAWIGSLAAIALSLVALVAIWQFQKPSKTVNQRYQLAIDDALKDRNLELAQRYQQKLLDLGSGAQVAAKQRIESLAKDGRISDAIKLAEQMVQPDSPPSPEIHLWLAQQYATGKSELSKEEAIAIAEFHVKQVVKFLDSEAGLNNKFPQVGMVRATIELQKNNVVGALELLSQIDNFWPAVALQVELYPFINRADLAIQKSISLVEFARQDAALFSEISEKFFAIWCGNLVEAQAESEFRLIARAWFERFPDNPQAKLEYSRLQFWEVDKLMSEGEQQDINQAAVLFLEAANRFGKEQHGFVSAWLNHRLAATVTDSGFRKMVGILEDSKEAPSYLLEILGTYAFQSGKTNRALALLTQATESDENNLVAWNNLAYIHSIIPDGELHFAFEAADRIVKAQPDNMTYRKTRAQVSLKLARWNQAIEDLKLALASEPNSDAINSNLALAYRGQGNLELAAWHEQLVKSK